MCEKFAQTDLTLPCGAGFFNRERIYR